MYRTKDNPVVCRFSQSGFKFSDGRPAKACATSYHRKCFRVGEPFTTRLRDDAGLVLPGLSDFPGFICEACTVRAADRSDQQHAECARDRDQEQDRKDLRGARPGVEHEPQADDQGQQTECRVQRVARAALD